MAMFAIVEVDDGYTVAEWGAGETADTAALKLGGILIDAGPYHSYEEAYAAIDALQADDEDDRRE
jgi:hypothetical protein